MNEKIKCIADLKNVAPEKESREKYLEFSKTVSNIFSGTLEFEKL